MFKNQDSILSLMGVGGGESSRTRPICRLPPGCRFYPSEEDLLNHYLTGKNNSVSADPADVHGYDLIRELNLYDYAPSDLPEDACFVHGYQGRKRHWFCYTENRGRVEWRRAKGGFWRKMGNIRAVFNGEDFVLGTRTKFVFYEVDSIKAAVRTPWIMYEYALLHHLKASFVLCRVFVKSHAVHSVSESVSAPHHIGINLNPSLTPNILEAEINDDDLTKELDDLLANTPDTVASFEFPSSIPPDWPSELVGSQLTTNELLSSTVEGDFLELGDLGH